MTWPRKGTRSIVVDGEAFLWHVPDGRVGWADDTITVGRDGAPFVLHLDACSWDGTPRPSIVAAATRWALARGWSPDAGPTRGIARLAPERFVFLPPLARRLPNIDELGAAYFEVEYVSPDGAVVHAARVGQGDLRLLCETRLSGLRIAPSLTMPRALRPDGTPRMDLFTFHVLDSERARAFLIGELLTLEPVDVGT